MMHVQYRLSAKASDQCKFDVKAQHQCKISKKAYPSGKSQGGGTSKKDGTLEAPPGHALLALLSHSPATSASASPSTSAITRSTPISAFRSRAAAAVAAAAAAAAVAVAVVVVVVAVAVIEPAAAGAPVRAFIECSEEINVMQGGQYERTEQLYQLRLQQPVRCTRLSAKHCIYARGSSATYAMFVDCNHMTD
jgi:hypothetical protein